MSGGLKCSYSKSEFRPCSGAVSWQVPCYFTNGDPLPLCEEHGPYWNRLHPMGPKAEPAPVAAKAVRR